MGVKAGVPDILIFTPPPDADAVGAALELKASKRTRVTPAQLQWIEDLRDCGWVARVCYGADESIRWLKSIGYTLERLDR